VIGVIVKLLTGGLLDKVLDLVADHAEGKITKAQLDADIQKARIEAEKAADAEFSKMAAAIAESTQATVRVSPVIQRAWAAGMFLLFAALFWYLIGAPAFQVVTGTQWPYPEQALNWSYLLLSIMTSGAPFVFRR
jgi:hypothetical protein